MFKSRIISPDQAAMGYNNEGRGKLLGYIAIPGQHEAKCTYRISTGGDPGKQPHEPCNCRLGLWQEIRPKKLVSTKNRKTAKRVTPIKPARKQKTPKKKKLK